MKKVVAFGEIMMRLNPPDYRRFMQTDCMISNYVGAEANMCVFLSYNGIHTDYITKLPNNMIAQCAMAQLHKYDVNTDNVVWGGDRIGVFFLERGASQRPSKIVYDRKYSSIALSEPSDYDWDKLLDGADVFTCSGITPALGGHMPEICLQACETAKKKGICVVLDLNYRANLWTPDQAKETMRKIAPAVDILVGNEEDAEKTLGIKPKGTDVSKGKLNGDAYAEIASEISKTFGCKKVAFTLRTSHSASDNGWAGMLWTEGEAYFSKNYEIHIVDRVGGGDSFTSGLIYAHLNTYDPQKTVEFAVAASCLKQTIEGDFNLTTISEVEKLMNGDGSGRVQR